MALLAEQVRVVQCKVVWGDWRNRDVEPIGVELERVAHLCTGAGEHIGFWNGFHWRDVLTHEVIRNLRCWRTKLTASPSQYFRVPMIGKEPNDGEVSAEE